MLHYDVLFGMKLEHSYDKNTTLASFCYEL